MKNNNNLDDNDDDTFIDEIFRRIITNILFFYIVFSYFLGISIGIKFSFYLLKYFGFIPICPHFISSMNLLNYK